MINKLEPIESQEPQQKQQDTIQDMWDGPDVNPVARGTYQYSYSQAKTNTKKNKKKNAKQKMQAIGYK